MKTHLTRRRVLLIGWSVGIAAGVLVAVAGVVSELTGRVWVAAAAFALGMAATVGTAVALIPPWRRTMPADRESKP